MPQARSSGSGRGSTSGGKASTGSKSTGRSSGGSSTRTKRSSSSSGSTRAGGGRSSTESSGRRAQSQTAAGEDPRFEQVAQRIRKLNERIIEASKDAGETTLSSYEKALKAIAGSLERGPGSSDVEWVSNLATTQAKFIRDVTTAWTSAARNALK